MRYNPSNSIFSCYGSGQQDISIYKKNSGSGSVERILASNKFPALRFEKHFLFFLLLERRAGYCFLTERSGRPFFGSLWEACGTTPQRSSLHPVERKISGRTDPRRSAGGGSVP